jgi:hypothetical protein
MLNRPLCHSKRVHRSTSIGIFERRVLAMVFVSPLSLQKVRPPICPRVTHRASPCIPADSDFVI